MDATTKELIEKLEKTVVDFKKANDERLDAIEARGNADPVLTERVDELNNEVSNLVAQVEEATATAVEASKLVQRQGLGGSADAALEDAKKFYSMVTGVSIHEVQPDLQAFQAYKKAFEAYLRKGQKGYQNALEVGSDPSGGYYVTPDTSGEIVDLMYETSPMRSICSVQAIGTDALEGVNRLTQASSGGWVAETAARTATDAPTIGGWRIPVHEQYAYPETTQKMLDDANFGVEAWLAAEIAEILTFTENTAFLTGTGVGQPRGLLTYGHGTPSSSAWNVIERIPTGASGAFLTTGSPGTSGDCLITTVYSLKAPYVQGARWLMSRTTEAAVRKLKDGDGNYLWQMDFQNFNAVTLLGFPITRAEDMPAIAANSLSIAFGNFARAYKIVDRTGIRILRDPYTNKPYVGFYTTKRVGGDVINFEAVKLVRFAAAAS